jgi:PKD repeat protein
MRGRAEPIILLALALAGLLLAPATRPAYGAVSYVPGVKPNNAAAYAASGSWNLPGSPSPPFSQFINLNFTSISVTKVSGANITASQTFSYANGTTRQDIVQGGVDTDSGNITFWFIAANLTAGVPIYTTPNAPVINRTITQSVAGSIRSINVLNSTQVSPNSSSTLMVWWDQKTGILVRIDLQLTVSIPNTPVGTASLHAKLFQTNIWSPGPGFGMLAVPNSLTVLVGSSSNGTIIFLSERGFSGNIIIDYSLPCSSFCPTISINPMTVFLPSGGRVFASFSVAAPLGVATATYPLSIFAGSGPFTGNSTIVTVKVTGSPTTTTLSNDPSSPDWRIGSPTWSSRNGTLDGSGLSGSPSPKIISAATFSSDRTVQVKLKTITQGTQSWYVAWAVGKYVSETDRAGILLGTSGVLEMFVSQQQPTGLVDNIYTAPTTLSDLTWHTARMVFSGNNAQVYLDGVRYLNVTDSIIGVLGSCNIELASWGNSESQFSNATITSSTIADEPPVADFILPPQPIRIGEVVSFNASPSTDPDGFITNYSWNFGDGSTGLGEFPSHLYTSPGNYTVTLKVTDSSGLSSTASHQVTVVQPLTHDVGIVSVDPEPKTAISGQTVVVGLQLVNLGQQAETVDIVVFYDSHVAAMAHGVNVPLTGAIIVGNYTPPQPVFPIFVSVAWDTSGVPAGNYTISAAVILPTDQNPTNNHLTDGQVTILPPPVLSLTPTSGSLGDKVLVHGSGFPLSSFPGQPFSYPVTIQVTFDDQFLGLTTTSDGTFNFVFDVPHAQIGSHEIHAYAELYPFPVEATANFIVVPEPISPTVSVSVGTVYFPGDTATIYVLVTLSGNPVQSTSVHLRLILPNGTTTNLILQPVSPGLYKASFVISTTGPLGTYAVVATVQQNGLSASNLGAFEVKPSWLQANGQALLTASSIAGALGLVGIIAVAWRGGYLTKRRTDSLSKQNA